MIERVADLLKCVVQRGIAILLVDRR